MDDRTATLSPSQPPLPAQNNAHLGSILSNLYEFIKRKKPFRFLLLRLWQNAYEQYKVGRAKN